MAMDKAVLEQLQQQPGRGTQPEMCLYLCGADVPDPWGKAAADFASCAALIEVGAGLHLT
jgi:protein-tyrosine phosphatase